MVMDCRPYALGANSLYPWRAALTDYLLLDYLLFDCLPLAYPPLAYHIVGGIFVASSRRQPQYFVTLLASCV